MANATTLSANAINDHWFGKVTPTVPSTYYLAISTTEVQNDGSGLTEPTDANYERVAISNLKTSFGNSSGGVVSNITEFSFPESSTNQGIIGYWAILDTVTGGNVYWKGALTASKTVESQTTLVVPVGAIQITTR